MDNRCMLAPHRNGHAANPAGKRPPPHQATPMQGLYGRSLVDPKFTQPLRFAWRKGIPFYSVDIGRATGGQ